MTDTDDGSCPVGCGLEWHGLPMPEGCPGQGCPGAFATEKEIAQWRNTHS